MTRLIAEFLLGVIVGYALGCLSSRRKSRDFGTEGDPRWYDSQ